MRPNEIKTEGLFIPSRNIVSGEPNDVAGIAHMLAEYGVVGHMIDPNEVADTDSPELLPFNFTKHSLGHIGFSELRTFTEDIGLGRNAHMKFWSRLAQINHKIVTADESSLAPLSYRNRFSGVTEAYRTLCSSEMRVTPTGIEKPLLYKRVQSPEDKMLARPYKRYGMPTPQELPDIYVDATKLYTLLTEKFIGKKTDGAVIQLINNRIAQRAVQEGPK